ncbi:zinc finger protein 484-like [Uloborus diversus]|uniref:zinc finger protein 484-like n=1 Tax=Uloborus diversus TaxID=327109 RepID=UPI0024098AE4|nr:zinc finger protein 484-like [Uloborus diversus]
MRESDLARNRFHLRLEDIRRHFKEAFQERSTYVINICPMCNYSTPYKSNLKKHMLVHSRFRPHVCDICSKSFSQKENLKQHMKVHTGERPFSSSYCRPTKTYLTLYEKLRVIEESESNPSEKKVNMAKRLGLPASTLNTILIKKDEIREQILKFGLSSTTRKTRKESKYSDLEVELFEWYKCELEAGFQDPDYFFYKNKAPQIAVLTCTVCNYSTVNSAHMKRHAVVHSGERPYVCEFCNKTFNRKDYLKIHKMIHSGERPFECPLCSKAFTQKQSLKMHLTTHMK